MAVAVVVDEGAAVAPGFAGAADACFFADVGERAIAVVVIEDVFSVVGDVEIFPAIVVVIADANSLAPSGVSEAYFLGDVGERAVVIVVIEMAGLRFSMCGIESGAVDDENIRPAIVVVVEDSDAGAGGFDDVLFTVDAAENHGIGEAGLLGDVGEMSEGFRIGFGDLICADQKRKGHNRTKREPQPRELETARRTMSRTGNHELLAY